MNVIMFQILNNFEFIVKWCLDIKQYCVFEYYFEMMFNLIKFVLLYMFKVYYGLLYFE